MTRAQVLKAQEFARLCVRIERAGDGGPQAAVAYLHARHRAANEAEQARELAAASWLVAVFVALALVVLSACVHVGGYASSDTGSGVVVTITGPTTTVRP